METGISPSTGRLRLFGVIVGAVTLVAGIPVTPGVMTAVFRSVEFAKPIGIAIGILLICFVSYLLVSADRFYRRHRCLIYAGMAIAAAGSMALFVALALAPAFEESSLGAGMYGFLGAWYGVLLLADAIVLFVRMRRTRKITP